MDPNTINFYDDDMVLISTSSTKPLWHKAMQRQGDLTTGGVSIRFVLILRLPYDHFYGAYKSELIRFHIKFKFFLLKNATSVSGSCLQK